MAHERIAGVGLSKPNDEQKRTRESARVPESERREPFDQTRNLLGSADATLQRGIHVDDMTR